MDCFIPKGNYNYKGSLKIQNIYKNNYVGVGIRLFGEGQFWDDRTTLTYQDTTGFALGIQYGKGTEVDHLKIVGQFIQPSETGLAYYNLAQGNFGKQANSTGHSD